jgi:hypothetical protein
MTPEEQILLLSSFYSLSSDQMQALGALMNQSPDWNQIITASRFHSLTPLLAKHMSDGDLQEKLPSSAYEKTIGLSRLQTARSLKIVSVFQELSSKLKENNVDFILLKGLFLANNYYSNPALRPMQDIDLLVKKENLQQIVKLMEELGARRLVELQSDYINSLLQHIPPFIYKEVIIEIHTNITAANEPYSFTGDILWNNTLTLEIQKVNTRVFCSRIESDIYLVSIYSGMFRPPKFKLIWFTDLMQILSGSDLYDSSKIKLIANQTNSAQTLKEVSFLLNNFWNFKVEEKLSVSAQIPDNRLLQNFRDGILRKKKPDEYYTFNTWRRIPGTYNKIRFVLGLAFPSTDFMIKKYKLKSRLPLFPLYFFNALKVSFKGIKILFTK